MTLQDAFNFTPEDLAANREGIITERQRDIVDAWREQFTKGSKYMVLLYLTFFPILVLISMGVQYRNEGKGIDDFLNSQDWLIFLVVILMITGMLVFSYGMTYLLQWDAIYKRLSVVEGTASPFIGEGFYRGGRYKRYELTLKNGRFRKKLFRFMHEKQAKAFYKGVPYRVYYVKMTPFDIILSAERLDE